MSETDPRLAPALPASPPSRREAMEPWLFIAPSVLLLLCIGLYPTIYTFVASLQIWVMGMSPPVFGGAQNYPGLAVSAILSGIFAWNDLLYAFILTPSPASRTASTVVLSYLGGYVIPWPKVMASATLVCAPVIIGGVIVHKYIARGLTMGAVK